MLIWLNCWLAPSHKTSVFVGLSFSLLADNLQLTYFWKYGKYRQNPNFKPGVFDHGELEKMSLCDSNNDRQSEMAAETGNTYISEITIDSVKIPTVYLGVSTMDLDKDKTLAKWLQPISEVEMWPLKPLKLWRQLWGFRPRARRNCLRTTETTDNRK